jgi:hypothetical protein
LPTTTKADEVNGALFENDKAGNPARPDYRGDLTIGGTKYKLAAWLKSGRRGPFISLAATLDDQPMQPAPKPSDPLDDEIPW